MNLKENMQHNLYNILILAVLISGVWTLAGCNRSQNSEPVIATAGNREIDWDLVVRSYHLEPKWDRGLTEREAYMNQVSFLIDQKLYAQAAEVAGLHEIPAIEKYITFIREKEMIKELYRQNVEEQVEISEEQFRQAYVYFKKKVEFQYIFSEDKQRAEHYLQQLQNQPFEEIALLNPVEDEKGVTPEFGFGDMAEVVENVVFNLAYNETGGPIAVDGRWMVVKVTGGKVDKFMAENDYAATKPKLRKIIFNRKAREISDQYIYELLKDEDIDINPDAFFPLAAQFEAIVEDKETKDPFPVYLNDSELKVARSNVEADWDKPLVTFGDQTMTVYTFLETLFNMPTGLRPQVNFKPQLKKAIAVVVRNAYLVDRAYAQNLDKNQRVLYESQWQIDAVLARTWLKSYRDELQCSEAEVEAMKKHENFEELNRRFNNNLTDEQVRNLLLDKKFALLKMQLADSLRSVYTVELDSTEFISNITHPEKLIDHRPVAFSYREKFQ